MDESLLLAELAVVYRYLALDYPVGMPKRHAYGTIAGVYQSRQSMQQVKERLEDLYRHYDSKRMMTSTRLRLYQRLEEESLCYWQALADLRAGYVNVPARRISLHVDER